MQIHHKDGRFWWGTRNNVGLHQERWLKKIDNVGGNLWWWRIISLWRCPLPHITCNRKVFPDKNVPFLEDWRVQSSDLIKIEQLWRELNNSWNESNSIPKSLGITAKKNWKNSQWENLDIVPLNVTEFVSFLMIHYKLEKNVSTFIWE